MNNQNYRDMVDHVVDSLPGAWNGRIKQLPNAAPATVNITLQFPRGDERQGMQIIYRRRDIYILGYRTTGGTSYVTFDQRAAVAGATVLRFDGDYGALGWNRQGLAVNAGGPMVSVNELDIALHQASAGAASAGQMCVIAIALAEGVRFKNVEAAVRAGGRISTDMVDWDGQLAAGEAVLRQG